MKKYFKATLLLAIMMFCLTGCGKDKIKDDLYSFLSEELPAVQEKQVEAVNTYNEYFSAEDMDSAQLLTLLNDTILPEYEEYMTELNAIEVSTDEVKTIKEKYVESAQYQYDAMKTVKDAIENADSDKLTEANDLLEKAKTSLNEYNTQVVELAEAHNITIQGLEQNNVIDSSTDSEGSTDTEATTAADSTDSTDATTAE